MVIERKNIDGSIDYIFSIGKPFLYNNKSLYLIDKVIPIKEQSFFILPQEKNYYAIINVYYSVDDNVFIYDVVKKSSFYIDSYDSEALSNFLPVAQFVLQQSLNSFIVKKINQFSDLSTFAITTIFEKGDEGVRGSQGETGIQGVTGMQGLQGITGLQGVTGIQGETSIGIQGATGLQGETGIYPDKDMYLYLKFKNIDGPLLDYSVYEKDFEWFETGSFFTGIVFYEDGSTGIDIIEIEPPYYNVIEGIKDFAHEIVYTEGEVGYKRKGFIGFSGVIQAWIKISTPPIPAFSYEYNFYTGMIGYPVKFINNSLYEEEVTWYIENITYNANIIQHSFGSTGIYLVKLVAKNKNGVTSITDLIKIE